MLPTICLALALAAGPARAEHDGEHLDLDAALAPAYEAYETAGGTAADAVRQAWDTVPTVFPCEGEPESLQQIVNGCFETLDPHLDEVLTRVWTTYDETWDTAWESTGPVWDAYYDPLPGEDADAVWSFVLRTVLGP